MAKGPTFREWTAAKMADPKFAKGYRTARARIDAVDRLIRSLDGYRVDANMSKAELARSIDAKPEIVRRLLTKDGANPTMETFVEIADALGLEVRLVPKEAPETKPKRMAKTDATAATVQPRPSTGRRAGTKKNVHAYA